MTRDEALAMVMNNLADVTGEVGEALDVLRGEDPEVVNWKGKYNDLKSEYVRRFTEKPIDTGTPEPTPEDQEEKVKVYTVEQMNYYGGTE